MLFSKSLTKTVVFALLIAAIWVWTQSDGLACPTCKDGMVTGDGNHEAMVQGYFWSIVFMMSMPFLILAGLSSYFYFEIRRARARGWQPTQMVTETVSQSTPAAVR